MIVIVDSGVSEEFCGKKDIVFPLEESEQQLINSGHGTAVFDIINKKCGSFAEIINFRIVGIENGVDEETLISALKYINENMHADIVNLSLGISICNDIQSLYEICCCLTGKGTIIVSAFENLGGITYPAAFDNVIGVTSGGLCKIIDDFEYYDDEVVNVGAKGGVQHLVWNSPSHAFLSGNSFACAHVTAKVAEFVLQGYKTKKSILRKFEECSVKSYKSRGKFVNRDIPFTIQKAVLFPFNKEMHSLIRYEKLHSFEITDIYDTKYSAKVGATTTNLMNDVMVPQYVIKNITKLDIEQFDTLILGHISELSLALDKDRFILNLIKKVYDAGKNIYAFDDLSQYKLDLSDKIYYPCVYPKDLPVYRFGMLNRISKPVVGVFGTSSRQGKFTVQLKIRELLTNAGYVVGEIGTEPTSLLFGMDYVFPMGYNSSVYIEGNDVVRYLNEAVGRLCFLNKDIILVGSQSGTLPYDIGNISQFSIMQYSFLMGTMPDCVVLCINLYDSWEYLHRTIDFVESSVSCKVIALAALPVTINENEIGWKRSIGKQLSNEKFYDLQIRFEREFNRPLYKIGKEKDMSIMVSQIIDFFD